jgi:hypothetical protein
VEPDIDRRIAEASERAAEAAERTARAHEAAAEEHERHANVAEQIGENLEDVHLAREHAQRIRAAAAIDADVARRERDIGSRHSP